MCSGEPSLGDFQLFPYSGCTNDTVDGCDFPKPERASGYKSGSVKASPGYFGITMNSGIAVDMTTAFHTALYRFQFNPTATTANTSTSPLILLDLTDLSDSRQDNSSIHVDSSTGRMTGNGHFLPSFGSGSYVGS